MCERESERDGWLLYFDCFLMSCDRKCFVVLPHGTVAWFAVFDGGISGLYSLTFMRNKIDSLYWSDRSLRKQSKSLYSRWKKNGAYTLQYVKLVAVWETHKIK